MGLQAQNKNNIGLAGLLMLDMVSEAVGQISLTAK